MFLCMRPVCSRPAHGRGGSGLLCIPLLLEDLGVVVGLVLAGLKGADSQTLR